MAVENVVISYKADISDVKRQVRQLQRLNQQLGKNLGKDFTKGATIVSRELTKINTVAKGIKLPLGGITNQTKQFTTVLKDVNGRLTTVRQTVAGTGKNIKILNQTVRNGANVTRTMGQNFATLAKRAALTIPLWFAIRRGIGSVVTIIREGLKAIVDFDRALQKARRNLQGSAEQIEANFLTLRQEITKLSLETGKSVEDITNAFQKFATVGFDFETSLAGANNATKLSILLFGDAEETAFAFARSMRVLVDNSKDAIPASEQIADVMALTAELWKTNAFELGELTQSLEKFAPVAKTAGFSAEETVKVLSALSTAGVRAGRGGRLLRTSIVRLVTSTDKLATSLGIKVNPEVDRTFDLFIKTLDVLGKAGGEAGKVSPAFEKVVKSIFGLRSSDAIKGLIALDKNLKQVLATTGDVGKFNKEFQEVNKTVFQLVAQFRNFNKEIGKAFVVGLTGGEDFKDSLEEILALQKALITNARAVGRALAISTQVTFGFTGGEASEEFLKQASRIINNIKKALKISQDGLSEVSEDLKKQFEDLDPVEIDIPVKLGNFKITTEQQSKLIQQLIKDQIERLKLQGATESQLLKIEDRLRRQFDINDDILDQKKRELEIDRKINEEQRLRTQLSSESVKLFKIAKEEGVGTAKAIGEVLAGQKDFNIFLRQGGKDVELFKKNFGDIFEQQQALRFFRGDRVFGQEGLRGGANIPIREQAIQRGITPAGAVGAFQRARARIGLTQQVQQTNTINITNNIDGGNPEEIKRIVEDTIIKGYQDPNSKIAKEAKDFTLNI